MRARNQPLIIAHFRRKKHLAMWRKADDSRADRSSAYIGNIGLRLERYLMTIDARLGAVTSPMVVE